LPLPGSAVRPSDSVGGMLFDSFPPSRGQSFPPFSHSFDRFSPLRKARLPPGSSSGCGFFFLVESYSRRTFPAPTHPPFFQSVVSVVVSSNNLSRTEGGTAPIPPGMRLIPPWQLQTLTVFSVSSSLIFSNPLYLLQVPFNPGVGQFSSRMRTRFTQEKTRWVTLAPSEVPPAQ